MGARSGALYHHWTASRPGSQRVARATIRADFRDAGALHPLRPGTGRGPCGWRYALWRA